VRAMKFTLRLAQPDDVPVLESLIQDSCRVLGLTDYSPSQIEGALKSAWGVDSQLINDQTYYVVLTNDQEIVGCGGWSYRETLFGASNALNRDSEIIDPIHGSARIRAFFVEPDWVRKGIGGQILGHCEQQAIKRGYRRFALMATLPGQRLYQKYGYVADAGVDFPLENGLSIRFVPMRKKLKDTGNEKRQI